LLVGLVFFLRQNQGSLLKVALLLVHVAQLYYYFAPDLVRFTVLSLANESQRFFEPVFLDAFAELE
jgi:hypothetical protein